MLDPAKAVTTDLSPADWERIERVYQTTEPLAIIAKEYGITVQKIVAYATRENWPLRGERQRARKREKPSRLSDTATLRNRLTGLVERQIAEIEERLADDAQARDHERDARTLSNLTRTLDKLIELKRAAAAERAEVKRTKEKAATDGDAGEDALREDLVRRLARIAAAGTD